MNYYIPYFNMYPNVVTPTLGSTASGGILSKILGKSLNWSSILTNTQKTLGIVNQAIPMFKQVSPIVKNAKTMFKVMNEFKKEDTILSSNNETIIDNNDNINVNSDKSIINTVNEGPTFFLN